jgi:tetratricopeptide (TPR) repeat protein
MKLALVVVLAVLPSLAWAPLAWASPATELLDRGLRAYAVGKYDDAIADFQRGYQLEPRAELLYALGQAQRMKGDCRAAAASYRAYLRTAPPERSARPARENLRRCEAQIASEPPSPPPSTTADASHSTAADASHSTAADGGDAAASASIGVAAPRRRWWRDPAGDTLAALGIAALGAGGASWGIGEAGARSLDGATSYGAFAAHGAQADAYDRERTAGIITVAVGGALVVSGVARWLYVSRRR